MDHAFIGLNFITIGNRAMTTPIVYQIRVKEHLGEEWTAWFYPFVICNSANGEASLTGPVRDQAELFGLLLKMQSLNLTLLAVNQVEPAQQNE
jgi:hypothetical protein